LYRCLESAKQIAQKAREEMKTICPANRPHDPG
jgi:hypothetical protein